MKEAAALAFATLDADLRADIDDLTVTPTGNLQKIAEHGHRADGIVGSMLEHSRSSSGERRMVDLNALIDEALNLAYHGARARSDLQHHPGAGFRRGHRPDRTGTTGYDTGVAQPVRQRLLRFHGAGS